MKAIERQLPGYSADFLVGFLERTHFPSAFFDRPGPVFFSPHPHEPRNHPV